MNKLLFNLMLFVTLALLAGCKHVPMVSKGEDAASKQFRLPPRNMAGVYIYRDSGWTGKAQVKPVWLDGQLLGSLPNATYFYLELSPGTHMLAIQAAPGPNDLRFNVSGGRNYYFSQVFNHKVPVVGGVIGAFVSVATFEAVNEQDGQSGVMSCRQAVLQGVIPAGASARATATTQAECIAALEAESELQPISKKVALSGKDDNLSSLMVLNDRPTQNERKAIVKWGSEREQCVKDFPSPRDDYYQIGVDSFNQGQKLIQELSKGEMTYGQFAKRRKEIKQAGLAKAQAIQAR